MKYFVLVLSLGITIYANDYCHSEDGVSGICMEYKDCPHLKDIMQNAPILTIHNILKQYGGCGNRTENIHLCCTVIPHETIESVTSTSSPVSVVYDEDLFNAVKEGNHSEIETLLKAGADLNAKSDLFKGYTVLIVAAEYNHESVVDTLLKAGADIEGKMSAGPTALMMAALKGHTSVVQALIKAGASIDAQKADGTTALMMAALKGHTSVVQALIKAGASIDAKKADGRTPLYLASRNGHLSIVETLIKEKADVDMRANDGTTALMAASGSNHVSVVEALKEAGAAVNRKADDGTTALAKAAFRGHIAVVQALIKAGAEINSKRNDGASALYGAASNGHISVVQDLLEAGADPSVIYKDGSTPLHAAGEQGHISIVDTLVKAGTDINSTRNDGITAVGIAELNGHYSIAEYLRKLGAPSQIPTITSPEAVLSNRSACKDGWLSFGDSCYFFGQEFIEWDAGRQECLSMGSDYVKITSDEEFDFLLTQVNDYTWIGMNDIDIEGNFLWVSDNTPAAIIRQRFHLGEPNDLLGIEDCIGFYYLHMKFRLNDTICKEASHKYMCKMKSNVIFV